MDNRINTLIESGFLPPSLRFIKEDKRGSEYGYYQAIPSPKDGTIRVFRRDKDGNLEWACNFDDQISFGHWAKEAT